MLSSSKLLHLHGSDRHCHHLFKEDLQCHTRDEGEGVAVLFWA